MGRFEYAIQKNQYFLTPAVGWLDNRRKKNLYYCDNFGSYDFRLCFAWFNLRCSVGVLKRK